MGPWKPEALAEFIFPGMLVTITQYSPNNLQLGMFLTRWFLEPKSTPQSLPSQPRGHSVPCLPTPGPPFSHLPRHRTRPCPSKATRPRAPALPHTDSYNIHLTKPSCFSHPTHLYRRRGRHLTPDLHIALQRRACTLKCSV